MAFWDSWFKTPCDGCGEKFAAAELTEFDEQSVCSDCKTELEEQKAAELRATEERRMAEEAARKALLDRPLSVQPYASKATGKDSKF